MRQGAEGIFSMNRLRLSILLAAMLVLQLEAYCQSKIPTNTWRTHLSYRDVIDVSVGDDIAAATASSLFLIQENEITTITKENGLTDIGISSIAYINTFLLVGYRNGNIDILDDNQISNYRFIIDSDIQESKSINRIVEYDSKAYILTDFGVVIFDPIQEVVLDSYTNLSEVGDNMAIRMDR